MISKSINEGSQTRCSQRKKINKTLDLIAKEMVSFYHFKGKLRKNILIVRRSSFSLTFRKGIVEGSYE